MANSGHGTVSVIDEATNTVTATIPVGGSPLSVAVGVRGGRTAVRCPLRGREESVPALTAPSVARIRAVSAPTCSETLRRAIVQYGRA